MVKTDYLLQFMSTRIEFWRAELQAAFRSSDESRVSDRARFLEEYRLLARTPDDERAEPFQAEAHQNDVQLPNAATTSGGRPVLFFASLITALRVTSEVNASEMEQAKRWIHH